MNSRWIRLGLTLVGVGGVGVTSWMSIKSYEKAKTKTEKKDKAIAWAPAVASGVLTAGCIIGSHHLSNKEIAALTAACGYLTANRKKILAKVRQILGEEKAKEIEEEVAKETIKERKAAKVVVEETGYGRVHFIEEMFGREFYCSLDHVIWAEKKLNYMYTHGERVDYNTFYELVGLKKTKSGWEKGWPLSENLYEHKNFDNCYGYSCDEAIHFENTPIELENGEIGYMIDVQVNPPIYGYLDVEEQIDGYPR